MLEELGETWQFSGGQAIGTASIGEQTIAHGRSLKMHTILDPASAIILL